MKYLQEVKVDAGGNVYALFTNGQQTSDYDIANLFLRAEELNRTPGDILSYLPIWRTMGDLLVDWDSVETIARSFLN